MFSISANTTIAANITMLTNSVNTMRSISFFIFVVCIGLVGPC
jgi:hypothetical protein